MAKYAIVVGIGDYPGQGNNLPGPPNDRASMALLFKNKGFTIVKSLLNPYEKSEIITPVKEVCGNLKRGDVFLYYHSGHGAQVSGKVFESDGNSEAIVMPKAVATGKWQDLLLDRDFLGMMGWGPGGNRRVAVLDTCFSGGMSQGMKRNVKKRVLSPDLFSQEALLPQTHTMRQANNPNLLYLSACLEEQLSYETIFNNKWRGVFSYHLERASRFLKNNATWEQWVNEAAKDIDQVFTPQTSTIVGVAAKRPVFSY